MISFLRAAVFLGFIFLITGCSQSDLTAGGPTLTPTSGNAFVYVTLPGENRIAGFANDTTGALTGISGSPFNMPGQPFGIAASPNNRFLYVTLFQNNQISEFFISPANGTLTPVPCPTMATGLQPFRIVINPAGTLLYTLNDEGDVSGFSINPTTGCLTAISTASTNFGPGEITIDQSGQFLYVIATLGGINLYTINTNGTLTRQAVGGFDPGTNTMLAVKAVPTFELLMATDGGSTNNIRTLNINTNNGTLTPIVATPSGSSPANPTAIAFNTPLNATTPLFYIASFLSNNFTVNTVDATGAIGTTTLTVPLAPGPVGTGPVGLAVDPTGRFLYVASSGSTVSVFNANITAANITTALISTASTPGAPESIVVVGHP
ncbi:MAG TPA: beta-propeller fold lactonase family protein [Candidatus Angelobacter sp.]